MSPTIRITSLAATLVAALSVASCNEPRPSEAAAPPAQPVEVGVVVATPRPIAVVRELPGRVAPTRIADVRARVGGLVVSRSFEQGSDVKEGAALYQIDPAPYQAEVASAEAEVARAESSLMLARQQAERLQLLLKSQAASVAQYETAFATMKGAEATLQGARAAATKARLNLSYTTVRAPISGRIGRALLTEGALVEAGSTAVLATIQQLDPIYVDITQSVGELRKLRRDLASGLLSHVAPDSATVRLIMEDGAIYEQAGRLLFSDVTTDPSTGQVTLRVEIPNPGRELLPGMYVRARIEQAIDADAIAVPQQAVQRDADGLPQLLLVKDDGTIAVQPVALADIVDGKWVVREGLSGGEKVVVDGFQRVSAGSRATAVVLDEGSLRAVEKTVSTRTARAASSN